MRKYAVFLCCTLFILSIPCASFSVDANITQAEWATLMQDASFRAAEQKLGEAYKAAMATVSEADKQTLLAEQRAWASQRENEASTRFGKGTPAYSQFLIQTAQERTAVLQSHVAQQRIPTDASLYDLLKRSVFLKSWLALFSSEKDVPSWLAEYGKTKDGVVSPGGKITFGSQRYVVATVCKAHDCGNNQFYVLFAEDGKRAWGLLLLDEQRERFFNQPDTEKQKALRAVVECNYSNSDLDRYLCMWSCPR